MGAIQLPLPVVGAPARREEARWRVERPLGRVPCGPLELRMASDETTLEVELRCERCRAASTVERTVWSWSAPLWYATTPGHQAAPFAGEVVEPVADCARAAGPGCGDLMWLYDLGDRYRAVVERMRRRVEADAALAVLPFHAEAQATVYYALVLDRRRYVPQLVAQHPGIALVAAHADPWRGPGRLADGGLWGRAWNAVAGGRPLAEVTGAAAEVLGLEGEAARRLGWLARRVGPGADPARVVEASRCTAAPQSDLPARPYERLEWITAITTVRTAVGPDRVHEPWARAALRYASRHPRHFTRLPPATLGRFLEWLRLSGRRICRRVDPSDAFLDQERWWEDWAQDRWSRERLDALVGRGIRSFPEPPIDDWEAPNARIEAIRTPEELYFEGQRMGHCIFSYCDAVLRGRCAVYRVTCEGETSTLTLVGDGRGGWCYGEHAGTHNRPPTALAETEVGRWLASVPRADEGQE